jgi:hypothetical protein
MMDKPKQKLALDQPANYQIKVLGDLDERTNSTTFYVSAPVVIAGAVCYRYFVKRTQGEGVFSLC